ncbi:MAG: hypothetical protein JW736_07200 [Deltaproteobacteria bacterium]|nr:hypothetical protein [Deltaproteobacteria bacterium]
MAVFLTVFTPSSAMAVETSVTVTFAAGGIAGGIYFMLYITAGGGADFTQYIWGDRAIVNYADDTGWQFGFPRLTYETSGGSQGVPCIKIIRYEF